MPSSRALTIVSLLLALGLGACAGSDAPPSARGGEAALATHDPGDQPGSTRASREAARQAAAEGRRGDRTTAAGTPDVRAEIAPSARPSARPLFAVTPIEAREGEDGAGGTIPATHPVALDVDARQVPPRALDPVLHVRSVDGRVALRFVHYEHPEPGLMRFVVADRAVLPEGAQVFVQYGEDEGTRLELSASLALPQRGTP